MNISNLQDLLTLHLQKLYSMEEQIIVALPKMIEEATHDSLREALANHLEVTQEQLQRLVEVDADFPFLGKSHVDEAMEGILKAAEKGLIDIDDLDTKDAAIIASAQKVEHYEMSCYGTAAQYARHLEFDDAADLLDQSKEEEMEADEELNGLAEGGMLATGINEEAAE